MQGLYPIIRRKRVPLVVADAPPVVVGNVEPVPVVARVNDEARMPNGEGSPKLEVAGATVDASAPAVEARKPKRRAT